MENPQNNNCRVVDEAVAVCGVGAKRSDGKLPAHLWDGEPDPALPPLNVAVPGARLERPLNWALSNSFAFGGSNAALVFGRTG